MNVKVINGAKVVKILRDPFPATGLAVNNFTDQMVEYETLDEGFIQTKLAFLSHNLKPNWIKWKQATFLKNFFVFPDIEEIDDSHDPLYSAHEV